MQTRQRILEPCPALGTLRSLIDLAKQAPADGIRRDPLLEVDRLVLVRKPLRRPAVVQVTLRIHPQGPRPPIDAFAPIIIHGAPYAIVRLPHRPGKQVAQKRTPGAQCRETGRSTNQAGRAR